MSITYEPNLSITYEPQLNPEINSNMSEKDLDQMSPSSLCSVISKAKTAFDKNVSKLDTQYKDSSKARCQLEIYFSPVESKFNRAQKAWEILSDEDEYWRTKNADSTNDFAAYEAIIEEMMESFSNWHGKILNRPDSPTTQGQSSQIDTGQQQPIIQQMNRLTNKFQPKTLYLSDGYVKWHQFKKDFQTYYDFQKLKDHPLSVQRDALFECVESDIKQSVSSYVTNETHPIDSNNDVKSIIDLIDDLIKRINPLIVRRMDLIQLRQGATESIDKFITRLSSHVDAAECEKIEKPSEEIFNMIFVNGVRSTEVKKRLFEISPEQMSKKKIIETALTVTGAKDASQGKNEKSINEASAYNAQNGKVFKVHFFPQCCICIMHFRGYIYPLKM